MQAGGGLLYQGLNNGSYLSLTESTVSNNYVDSSFTGSTSPGLGGVPPGRTPQQSMCLNVLAGGTSNSSSHDAATTGLASRPSCALKQGSCV